MFCPASSTAGEPVSWRRSSSRNAFSVRSCRASTALFSVPFSTEYGRRSASTCPGWESRWFRLERSCSFVGLLALAFCTWFHAPLR